MHPDIERLAIQFDQSHARLGQIAESVTEEEWVACPPRGGWSIDECVAHLTLTNERYVPLLSEAIDAAPEFPVQLAHPKLRRDMVGWLLTRMMEPPVRLKLPTGPNFVPPGSSSRSSTMAAFDAVQAKIAELVRAMDGLDPTKIRITSPFNASLKYSLFSAMHILAAHERRHLWQAERVRGRLRKLA